MKLKMETIGRAIGLAVDLLQRLSYRLGNDDKVLHQQSIDGTVPGTMKHTRIEKHERYSDGKLYAPDPDDILGEILTEDNLPKFVAFMNEHPYSLDYFWMTMMIVGRAKKCLLALLKGELSHFRYSKGNYHTGDTCLSWAAVKCEPEVVDAMLASNDDNDVVVNLPFLGKLPIEFALSEIRRFASSKKFNHPSLIRLIRLLCLPELKPKIEIVHLLAPYTKTVNEIAYGYAEKGEFVMLAALLLAAKEQVLTPFKGEFSGMTVKDRISHMLDSWSLEDRICGRSRKKLNLIKASELFTVFEKAGDFTEACSGLVSVDDVIIQVSKVFKEMGRTIQFKDLDLRDVCSLDMKTLERICFQLGVPIPRPKKNAKNSHEDLPYRFTPKEMALGGSFRLFHGVTSVASSLPISVLPQSSAPAPYTDTRGRHIVRAMRHHTSATPPFKDFACVIANLRRAARYL